MTNKTKSGNIFVVKNCHSFLLQSAIVVLIVILQSGSGCYNQGLFFPQNLAACFCVGQVQLLWSITAVFFFIVLLENVEEGISGAS